MIACPNCGGNTRFDIVSQKIACEYCDSLFDPYSFDSKTSDAIESKQFEATVFTCPQCGGEILSTDNAAAGFCSFCGASTILYTRISHEKRPNYIIPFQKTKEDCKKAYSDLMKKAIFAPKELKSPELIDSFRGIYMPYWAYYITQKGGYTLKGTKTHRRGDYIITDHFDLHGDIDAYYKGLSYDASSSFSDNISEALAPFDVKGMKAFTPAYLSGFYADTADVDAKLYEPDVEAIAATETLSQVQKEPAYLGFSIQPPANPTNLLHTKIEAVDSTLFPVWFMSYRNGDRVAYATVNGQTGKVVADLPIDKRKYFFSSLLLAVLIFILLNLFITLVPKSFLIVVEIISLITLIISFLEFSDIGKKESFEDDRGLQSKGSSAPAGSAAQKGKRFGMVSLFLAMIISGIILLVHPVHDIYYYIGAIICLITETITLMDTIHAYNILSTRRLPQFDKQGGDDRA